MTQIGFVGLGKMGANMVHRICRDSEHEVVAYDSNRDAVKGAAANGAVGANTLSDLVRELRKPRIVWLMLPAGEITQRTIDRLSRMLDRDDTIVDGGNTKWTEDKRRAAALKKLGIHYVDVGTSGGVWGLEVGYCMMVGGANKAVGRLAPILDVLAPETAQNARAAIGERGWMHFGPPGAGHYVKMVHNGIEYGLMQAYAEGFDLFDKCEYELDNAKIAHLWGQGSVVRSWLCELAARAFEADGNDLHTLTGYTEDSGEGRWTIAEATDRDVPTPVMTASLHARFYSRGNGDYGHRVLAALRNQFGGHAVRDAEGGGPREAGAEPAGNDPGKAGAEPAANGPGKAGAEPARGGRKPRTSTSRGRTRR